MLYQGTMHYSGAHVRGVEVEQFEREFDTLAAATEGFRAQARELAALDLKLYGLTTTVELMAVAQVQAR